MTTEPTARLPVGAYVAAALAEANYGGDSGEDVDRFLDALARRGYQVVHDDVVARAALSEEAAVPLDTPERPAP